MSVMPSNLDSLLFQILISSRCHAAHAPSSLPLQRVPSDCLKMGAASPSTQGYQSGGHLLPLGRSPRLSAAFNSQTNKRRSYGPYNLTAFSQQVAGGNRSRGAVASATADLNKLDSWHSTELLCLE